MPANDISFSPVAGVSGEDAQYLGSLIRTVPGFPSEGILFRDFMPVFADPRGMRILVDALVSSIISRALRQGGSCWARYSPSAWAKGS